jgi:hypothetical protein
MARTISSILQYGSDLRGAEIVWDNSPSLAYNLTHWRDLEQIAYEGLLNVRMLRITG